MEQAHHTAANWWPRFIEPHPIPNRFDKTAGMTAKQRIKEEQALRERTTLLQRKLCRLTIRNARERTRQIQCLGNVDDHTRASLQLVKTLNEIIDVKRDLEDLRVQQEAA